MVPATAFPDALYRVLGIRQVVQGLLTGRVLGHGASASVDVLHATSMALVAVASSRFRSAALVQAALASAFAVAETVAGRRR